MQNTINSRFKMSFNNSGLMPQNNNFSNNLNSNNKIPVQTPVILTKSLNSPMIERIHKAKPGCSACGKKVA